MCKLVKKPCSAPGCGKLVEASGPPWCPEHKREQRQRSEHGRASSTARGYGVRWRRLRLSILARDFWICQVCERAGNEVDHIQPKYRGGTDDGSNLQTICRDCHALKSAGELSHAKRNPDRPEPGAIERTDWRF